ncbi:MAG: YlxR family protein [Polyangiaceae bacterium]
MTNVDPHEPKGKPARTCVGCGARESAEELLRLVASGDEVAFDLAGKSFGRGVHVHARAACIAKAPRGIARSLRREPHVDAAKLGQSLVDSCDRRMSGLILAAYRLRAVAVGADAALDALARARASVDPHVVAVVAVDAGSIAVRAELTRAAADGRVIAWSTKEALGALLGEQAVAVCAVRHGPIGVELKKMRAAADAGATATREGATCSRRPEAR